MFYLTKKSNFSKIVTAGKSIGINGCYRSRNNDLLQRIAIGKGIAAYTVKPVRKLHFLKTCTTIESKATNGSDSFWYDDH